MTDYLRSYSEVTLGLILRELIAIRAALERKEGPNYTMRRNAYMPPRGLCAYCNMEVREVYPWWTRNPAMGGASPIHQGCFGKYYPGDP